MEQATQAGGIHGFTNKNAVTGKAIAHEFGIYPVAAGSVKDLVEIQAQFDILLGLVTSKMPGSNPRALAMAKAHLQEGWYDVHTAFTVISGN